MWRTEIVRRAGRSFTRPIDPGNARCGKRLGPRKQIAPVGELMEVNVRAIFENCLLHLENCRNLTAMLYDLTGDVVHRVTRCSFPGRPPDNPANMVNAEDELRQPEFAGSLIDRILWQNPQRLGQSCIKVGRLPSVV